MKIQYRHVLEKLKDLELRVEEENLVLREEKEVRIYGEKDHFDYEKLFKNFKLI